MRKVFLFFFVFLILILWSVKTQPKTLAYDQSPYGINIGTFVPFWAKTEPKHYPKMAALLRVAGVKWARVIGSWRSLEPNDDKWHSERLGDLESLLQALQNEGISVCVNLVQIPEWASSAPPEVDSDTYPPSDLREYDEFVQEMVTRFSPWVDAWEIEGEISGKEGFVKKPEVFTEMFKRAIKIIKEKDPTTVILLSSFIPFEQNRGVITYWLREAGPYADILNVHKYGSDDEIRQKIWEFKNYIDDTNDPSLKTKPIWLTETNICKPDIAWCRNPSDGGERLKSRYQVALEKGMKKVFWFKMIHQLKTEEILWGPGILIAPWETQSGEFEPYEPMYSAYREMATGKKTISLSSGWNGITWPDIQGFTAKTALEDIDNDCEVGTGVVISRKRKDFWEEYVKNYGGRNFALNTGKDYYIKVARECDWSP